MLKEEVIIEDEKTIEVIMGVIVMIKITNIGTAIIQIRTIIITIHAHAHDIILIMILNVIYARKMAIQ